MTTPSTLPTLIVVSGLPATGKTTLAAHLRRELGLPLIAKDALKEALASALPENQPISRDTSRQIGRQAMTLMFAFARDLIESGTPCIVESNFIPALAVNDFEPFHSCACVRQVHCSLPQTVMLERYQRRIDQGERHAIHVDTVAIGEIVGRIAEGGSEPIPLGAPLLQVSTIDGYEPPLPQIIAFCRA